MKVAYVFSTQNASYILQNMIVPQLENGNHGFEVVGMFFFVDNTFLLIDGTDMGQRLSALAEKHSFLLMGCKKCIDDRDISDQLLGNVSIGCFPELHQALSQVEIDQVITL